MAQQSTRAALAECKRVVVKIGSRALLATDDGYARLAEAFATLRARGADGVLVSSGAVAAGRERLGFSERPKTVARLQAAAAAGQSLLMRAYEDAFEARGLHVAQLLLTHGDLSDRERYLNARRSVDELLRLGVVPIINENDTVAVEELRFGDNDQLAAMVATLVGADLMIVLTSVEGVLDDDGARVSLVSDVADVEGFVKPMDDDVGLGGMGSKLEAAKQAVAHGVPVVIGAAAQDGLFEDVLAGKDVGTLILPKGARLPSRKHWIAYTLKSRGRVVVDDGAVKALVERNKSLLPAGIVRVEGSFSAGDAVTVVNSGGAELARGLVRYSAAEVTKLAGGRSGEIAERIGNHAGDEVIHRDDLVVLDKL